MAWLGRFGQVLQRFGAALAVAGEAPAGVPMEGSSVAWPPALPDEARPPSQVRLTPHTAMSVPAANACVSILAGTLARLPYDVTVRGPVREPVAEHPLTALLAAPSQTLDPLLFWESMGRALHTHGNAFALIRRSTGGVPLELVLADGATIQRRQGRLVYTLSLAADTDHRAFLGAARAETVTVPAADVLHLAGPGYDWRTGLAPSPILFQARNALGMWLSASAHHASSLARGAHTPLMFKTDPGISSDEVQTVREEIEERYAGFMRAGTSPVLLPGLEPVRTGFSSIDLQLVDILKFSIEDIARVWMVPLFLLQHFEKSSGGWTNSNLSEQWTNFVRFSLNTHVARYTSAFDTKLLRPAERRRYATRIDTAPLVMGSLKDVAETMEVLVAKAAIWTPEEARAYTGHGPVPAGQRLRQPTGAPKQDEHTETAG